MATERRPYALLADSFWREPWPARAKLAVANLIAYLHDRWRTDRLTAETMFPIRIGWREAGSIFGGNSRAATLQGVVQVGCCITCSWAATPEHLAFSWPKWLFEQRLVSALPPLTALSESSSIDHHHQGREEQSPPKTPETDATEPASSKSPAQSPLLNLLSKLDGDLAEKIAWLADTGPQIEVDAASYSKPVPSLTVSYYRRYLGGERRFKNESEKAIRAARVAAKMGEFKLQGLI